MKKDITTLEDLLTDEEFLAAYDGRNGDRKEQWRQWVDWMISTFPPEIMQYLAVMSIYRPNHAGKSVSCP